MGEDLSACLWEERAAVERLAFRLEQENLVLVSGRQRLLPQSTAELTAASAAVDEIERRRVDLVRRFGEELRLGPNATLESIADAMDGPCAEALRGHRTALRALVGVVADLVDRNRELIARGLAATTDALALVGAAPPGAYDATGAARSGAFGAMVLDARA
jgi:hypothetical protein